MERVLDGRLFVTLVWLYCAGVAVSGCDREEPVPAESASTDPGFANNPAAINSTHSSQVLSGNTMGTTYSVVVPGIKQTDQVALKNAIDSTLERVNAAMSTYRPDSAISKFNRHSSTEYFAVPQSLIAVTKAALTIAAQTQGAFDPTVGPLVKRWGFGDEARRNIPTQQEIDLLRQSVGYQFLHINQTDSSINKNRPGLTLDLNAIAKGYAVDQLADNVASLGYSDYLVEIGGELRASGKNPRGEPWRIGVENPAGGSVQTGLRLVAGGVATSGDYRNAFEQDGVRYSHIIDPRDGYPVKHELASVTVVADSTMLADGWATALMVLGPEAGLATADKLGLASFFIVRSGSGKFSTLSSAAFKKLPQY